MRNPFRKPKVEAELAKIITPVVLAEAVASVDATEVLRPDDAPEWFGVDLAGAQDCAMGTSRFGSYVTLIDASGVPSENIPTNNPRAWQQAWREAHGEG